MMVQEDQQVVLATVNDDQAPAAVQDITMRNTVRMKDIVLCVDIMIKI